MTNFKVVKRVDSLDIKYFEYLVDNVIIVKEIYSGSTLFLNALNKYILLDEGNLDSFTKWVMTDVIDTNGATTTANSGILGLDGNYYAIPFPTEFYLRENPQPNEFGGVNYDYVLISDYTVSYSQYLDSDVYVDEFMGVKKQLSLWKSQNAATSQPGTVQGVKKILREFNTGFTLDGGMIELMLKSDSEPDLSYSPTSLAGKAYLIRYLFNNRLDRTAEVNNTGDISW